MWLFVDDTKSQTLFIAGDIAAERMLLLPPGVSILPNVFVLVVDTS